MKRVINWRNVAIEVAPQVAVTLTCAVTGTPLLFTVLWVALIAVAWAVITALMGIYVRENVAPKPKSDVEITLGNMEVGVSAALAPFEQSLRKANDALIAMSKSMEDHPLT